MPSTSPGHRLAALKPRLARSGLANVHPAQIAHERDDRIKRLAGKIDRVLVDAPCSGSGTLRRNPDLKWRQSAESLAALRPTQAAILAARGAPGEAGRPARLRDLQRAREPKTRRWRAAFDAASGEHSLACRRPKRWSAPMSPTPRRSSSGDGSSSLDASAWQPMVSSPRSGSVVELAAQCRQISNLARYPSVSRGILPVSVE